MADSPINPTLRIVARIVGNAAGPIGVGLTLTGWLNPLVGVAAMALGAAYVIWELLALDVVVRNVDGMLRFLAAIMIACTLVALSWNPVRVAIRNKTAQPHLPTAKEIADEVAKELPTKKLPEPQASQPTKIQTTPNQRQSAKPIALEDRAVMRLDQVELRGENIQLTFVNRGRTSVEGDMWVVGRIHILEQPRRYRGEPLLYGKDEDALFDQGGSLQAFQTTGTSIPPEEGVSFLADFLKAVTANPIVFKENWDNRKWIMYVTTVSSYGDRYGKMESRGCRYFVGTQPGYGFMCAGNNWDRPKN